MATPKLTLYVTEHLRTRVKTAAAHSNQSISDFLLPFIEAALELEEERMREQLAVNRDQLSVNKTGSANDSSVNCSLLTAHRRSSPLPEVG